MRHNWIFDVLSDLHAYAERNGLPELAQKIEEARLLARVEIGRIEGPDDGRPAAPYRAARRAH
jgi:hypothetical protein